MNVLINTVSSPNSCNHVNVTVTVNSVSRTYQILRQDVTKEPEDLEAAFIAIVRHICKTEGYTTALQIKNGLEGLTVKL
jgi:hypothetical protein